MLSHFLRTGQLALNALWPVSPWLSFLQFTHTVSCLSLSPHTRLACGDRHSVRTSPQFLCSTSYPRQVALPEPSLTSPNSALLATSSPRDNHSPNLYSIWLKSDISGTIGPKPPVPGLPVEGATSPTPSSWFPKGWFRQPPKPFATGATPAEESSLLQSLRQKSRPNRPQGSGVMAVQSWTAEGSRVQLDWSGDANVGVGGWNFGYGFRRRTRFRLLGDVGVFNFLPQRPPGAAKDGVADHFLQIGDFSNISPGGGAEDTGRGGRSVRSKGDTTVTHHVPNRILTTTMLFVVSSGYCSTSRLASKTITAALTVPSSLCGPLEREFRDEQNGTRAPSANPGFRGEKTAPKSKSQRNWTYKNNTRKFQPPIRVESNIRNKKNKTPATNYLQGPTPPGRYILKNRLFAESGQPPPSLAAPGGRWGRKLKTPTSPRSRKPCPLQDSASKIILRSIYKFI
ncbi:hypothetical protein ACJJTC_010831 [Scirpophaga incertulas]